MTGPIPYSSNPPGHTTLETEGVTRPLSPVAPHKGPWLYCPGWYPPPSEWASALVWPAFPGPGFHSPVPAPALGPHCDQTSLLSA